MDYKASKEHCLERILLDPSEEPTDLPLSLLKTITDDFSDHRKIGSGGFADVYKGELQNGTIVAVKKLFHNLDMGEEKFIKEVGCLMKAKHKNVVRFLGYCSDTQGKILNYEGKMIHAEERQRLLCFEFLPKGSLDKYITDISEGLEWRTRYKILKGICEGLHYLHQDIHMVHSDLKPANILLNDNMVPKIADFGLARCFDGKQSKTITSKVMGTWGYMAPESFDGVITFKSDIYSLGIIIMELLTGWKAYCDIQNVLQSWSVRFKSSQKDILWLQYVRVCAEIGRQCMDRNPADRPDTLYIIESLDRMERACGFPETDICASSATQMLDVYPLYIWFPSFKANKRMKCPVTLTNKTDDLIGVLITPTCLDVSNPEFPYIWEQPEFENDSHTFFRRLGPHSSETIYLTMKEQQLTPWLQVQKGMYFNVVMVTTKSEDDLKRLYQHCNNDTYWCEAALAKKLGTVVHRAKLRAAVTSDPECCQEVATFQFIQARENEYIYCMDVHPRKTWLLVGYSGGYVSVWNYETQGRVIMFQVTYLQELKSAKFIVGEHWFAVGDNKGVVHVYAYTFGAEEKIKELEAHRDKAVASLAVHPKCTLLLTASSGDIKLWDWSQGWTCVRVINAHYTMVRDLKVGPRDASTFATSSGYDIEVKVWDIHPPGAIATFKGRTPAFYTDSHQNFLVTLSLDLHSNSMNAMIWDLQTKRNVHTLCSGVHWSDHGYLDQIACHPTLPILAGITTQYASKMHQIVLWDVRTYRVMKRVELLVEGENLKMFFDGTEEITSLVVASDKAISITKINVATRHSK